MVNWDHNNLLQISVTFFWRYFKALPRSVDYVNGHFYFAY